MDFTCNVCGKLNTGVEDFGREVPNCAECLSTVRIRALVYALSQELFGTTLQLRDFPVLKGLRCVGMTDSDSYAKRLAVKFDYKNTFFDREPRLDITDSATLDEDAVDLLISSEVFEHVHPPLEDAFKNAFRLLRANGILLITMPYRVDAHPSLEHFPQLNDAGLAQLRGGPVLVNRTAEGELQMFDKLVFHGGHGSTLEMRVLNESALRRALLDAGFTGLHFYAEDYAPFGIRHAGSWSLPLAARKQPFELTPPLRTELLQQFGELHEHLRRMTSKIGQLQTDLHALQAENVRLNADNLALYTDLVARTEWAETLDREVRDLRAAIERLQAEFEDRTSWALTLERELANCTTSNAKLETEVDGRTKWALDLQSQFEERTRWALELDNRAKQLQTELSGLRTSWWTRLGRRLGLLR